MKTFTLSLLLGFISLISFNRISAQCTVSDIVIQNTTMINETFSSCTVKFDVTFNIKNNHGNKYIFIHTWLQNNYPNYFKCQNRQSTSNGSMAAPTQSDLLTALMNIGLDNSGDTPVTLNTYPPAGSVQLTTIDRISKVVLSDGSANITLQGILVTTAFNCTVPMVLVSDIWSSESSAAQTAHCTNCGIRSSWGYLSVFGFVNCAANSYNGVLTNNTTSSITGFYNVYADVDADEIFTPNTDTLLTGNTAFIIAAAGSIPLSGSIPQANGNQSLFLTVTQTSGPATDATRTFFLPKAVCGPLAVSFISFDAYRTGANKVLLKWETAVEENNKGFLVEQKTVGTQWKQVAFVSSRAVNGNSLSVLSYTLTDFNSNNNVTQYRIQQIDFDGRMRFSDVRVVPGEGSTKGLMIYPNPTSNGRVRLVFTEQATIRDVLLTDMFGRLIKQWRSISDNTLNINNLESGLYILKVITAKSGDQYSTTIMVKDY